MYKSTFLFRSFDKGTGEDSASYSWYQGMGNRTAVSHSLKVETIGFPITLLKLSRRNSYQPGKNGQKIGIRSTLTMKVMTQSGTPTLT